MMSSESHKSLHKGVLMINDNRVTNLADYAGQLNDAQAQNDRVELIIDRFDHWGNSNDTTARTCYATYCRVDEMAA